jgi:hypothetical protein
MNMDNFSEGTYCETTPPIPPAIKRDADDISLTSSTPSRRAKVRFAA